jgi:hypothetical protein
MPGQWAMETDLFPLRSQPLYVKRKTHSDSVRDNFSMRAIGLKASKTLDCVTPIDQNALFAPQKLKKQARIQWP